MIKLILSISLCLSLNDVHAQLKTIPTNIQTIIQNAQNQAFAGDIEPLEQILLDVETYENHEWLTYWQSYASYQAAIYFMVIKDKKRSESYVKTGIDLIESLKTPNSEEHALLGSIYSLSINLNPGEAIVLSNKANKQYERSLEQDANNIRGLLGIGRSDFYKPVIYGGGKKVEKYLKKALTVKSKQENPLTPNWGLEDVYFYLASFYEREKMKDEAKLYCQLGLKRFPGDYQLQGLLTKLN